MRHAFVFIAATLLWCPVVGKEQQPEEKHAGDDTVWTTLPKGSRAAVECLRTMASLLDGSGAGGTNYDSMYALARQRWIQFSLGDGISERPRQTVWRSRREVPPLSVDKASLILALDMLGLAVLAAPRLTPAVAYAARGSGGIVFGELADGYVWLERIEPGRRKPRLSFSNGTSFRHPNRERIRMLSDDATVRDWFVVFPTDGAMCSILARFSRPGGGAGTGFQWYPAILRRHFARTRKEGEAHDWPLLLRDNPCEAGGGPR